MPRPPEEDQALSGDEENDDEVEGDIFKSLYCFTFHSFHLVNFLVPTGFLDIICVS